MKIEKRAIRYVRSPELPVTPVWDGSEPIILGDGWALGADNLQWMVLRARRHKGRVKWQPVAFVASNKAVLKRVLREKGASLSREGEAALNALNETFRKWRETIQ